MDILIYCHGESMGDTERIIEGRGDYPLTEKGLNEAEITGLYLKSHHRITALYSSPLKRALQAAEKIAGITGIKPEVMEELTEFGTGHLTGLSPVKAREKYPWIKDVPDYRSLYSQETKLSFRMRAEMALMKIIWESSPDSTNLLVTHSSFTGQFFRAFLGMPITSEFFTAALKGSLSHVSIPGNGIRGIIKVNSREHLLR